MGLWRAVVVAKERRASSRPATNVVLGCVVVGGGEGKGLQKRERERERATSDSTRKEGEKEEKERKREGRKGAGIPG